MASIKISELNETTELESNDLFAVVDTVADETKKMSYGSLKTQMIGDTIATVSGHYTAVEGVTAKQITLDYPTGFTKDNCSVISVMMRNSTQQSQFWGTGTVMTLNSTVTGEVLNSVTLSSEKITLYLRNLYISTSTDGNANIRDIDLPNIDYKIILMKTN